MFQRKWEQQNTVLTTDDFFVCHSPHHLKVLPTCEPNKVRVTGPGVGNQPVHASYPVDFTVDTREAGFSDLEVTILVN